MGILERLRAKGSIKQEVEVKPREQPERKNVTVQSLLAQSQSDGRVSDSVDLQRIKRLPWGVPDFIDLTENLKTPNGKMQLRQQQSMALIHAAHANGLFASMRVGSGKTLISFLLPVAMDSLKAILFVPPDLHDKTLRDWDFYAPHWQLPVRGRLDIAKYSKLSQAKHADMLYEGDYDLIIADEGDALQHKTSARTKRLIRYMRDKPNTRFAFMSATMIKKSIRNFEHLMTFALKKNSPVPMKWEALQEWGWCLDIQSRTIYLPGEMQQLTEEKFSGSVDHQRKQARHFFAHRLRDTTGVAVYGEAFEDVPIVYQPVTPKAGVPAEINSALANLEATWEIGDKEISEIFEQHRFETELSMGFYYVWDWPGEPDKEWLKARRDWAKETREVLKLNRPGLDSPFLVASAAYRYWEAYENGEDTTGLFKTEYYLPWLEHKHKKPPPTKPIWLSDFVVELCLRWASQFDNGIIWVSHLPLATKLADHFPVYGQGTNAEHATASHIVCTARTQSKGKNLQHKYNNNLITSLDADTTLLEQIAGRTHREGQSKPVRMDYLFHTYVQQKSFTKLWERARFVEQMQGQPQKWCYGEHREPIAV